MKIVTAEEMQELDRRAIEKLHIPSINLMENAGKAVAEEALSFPVSSKILVICGKGNNGGDGFVAARYLAIKRRDVKILLIGRMDEVKHDPKINVYKLKAQKVEVVACPDLNSFNDFKEEMKDYDVIIDALFGIGLKTELKSPYSDIITYLNSLKSHIIAVDVPSGLDATTGKVLGAAVKAERTVTFAAVKKGLVEGEGPKYAGEVKVADIGIPVDG